MTLCTAASILVGIGVRSFMRWRAYWLLEAEVCEACAAGHADRLRRALCSAEAPGWKEAIANQPARRHGGAPPLLVACGAGRGDQSTSSDAEACIEVLLAAGARPDGQMVSGPSAGASALHILAGAAGDAEGRARCVKRLLQAGADPSLAAADGQTALARAEAAARECEGQVPPRSQPASGRVASAGRGGVHEARAPSTKRKPGPRSYLSDQADIVRLLAAECGRRAAAEEGGVLV